jgi:hypothetical protein
MATAEDKDSMPLSDEAETAATLLTIMAGAAADQSIAGSPVRNCSIAFQQAMTHHQLAAAFEEANQNHPLHEKPSTCWKQPPQQVPNPLLNTISKNLMAASSSDKNTTTSPMTNKPATVFLAQQLPYLQNTNNFMVHSPSTYSFLQSMINQQQASLAAAASASSLLSSSGNTTPNPLLLLAKNPLLLSSTSSSSAAIPGSTSSNMTMMTTKQEAEMVRREEVEKALNSKPQRGRKRGNLNEEERQELTRTRNREHAKSTRERKKHRHVELLDMERLYQVIMRQQELQGQRREAVCRFVEARQAMLQQILDNNNSSQEEEEESTATSAAGVTNVVDGLIQSRSEFRYHIRGQRGGAEIDGVTLMGLFDRSFAALLPAQGSEASYRYDEENIALTERGDAMLECSICFGSRTIKTLHMTVSFADETAKIISVDIAFLQEESSERPPSMGSLVSHPSVVSLDDRFVALQNGKRR